MYHATVNDLHSRSPESARRRLKQVTIPLSGTFSGCGFSLAAPCFPYRHIIIHICRCMLVHISCPVSSWCRTTVGFPFVSSRPAGRDMSFLELERALCRPKVLI